MWCSMENSKRNLSGVTQIYLSPAFEIEMHRLGHFQASHGAGGGREAVSLQPHALEHGNEKIGQGVIMLRIEGEMLAVLEAASGEDRRHVGGDVSIRIPQV